MTTITHQEKQVKATQSHIAVHAASAAFIASGIGVFAMGLMTTGAVISEGLKNALNWWNPAGPLVGKTGIAILAWLISWVLMNTVWKDKELELHKSFTITLVLIIVGVLLTFPPVFEIFG